MVADVQQVLQVMQGAGYGLQVQQGDHGPYLLGKNGQSQYGVFFLACENGQNCLGMQFYTSYNAQISLEQVNQFNMDNNFARATLEKPGTVGMQMEIITLRDGISQPIFLQYAKLWMELMGDIEKVAGY